MKKVLILLSALALLPACAPPTPPILSVTPTRTPQAASETPLPGVISPQPTLTPTPEPTQTPIPSATPTLPPPPEPAPLIHEESGPIYDTPIQIPVGKNGIEYRGAGVPDMEIVGPNGLVIAPDGVFIIGDVQGNRLLRYDSAGTRLEDIDLTPLDILNISDMVGAGDSLYILEISFKVLPERWRVNHLTTAGELVSQYDLPKGYRFEDGLYGLAIGYPGVGESQILIEMHPEGVSRYYRIPASPAELPEELPALPVYGQELRQLSAGPGELAVLGLGEQEFVSQASAGATLSLLSARADGSLYLQREDMLAWEPVITTDLTIHYVSMTGEVMGVARYPLMDWYFHIWRFLTVGPDGNVYALITRRRSVDILRLNFYRELTPMLAEAAEPAITRQSLEASPNFDCSLIQRLPPNSTEAEQIVAEFIANFQQDWPTEYMAFEQLWSLDRLGEYAVIQGMITQEESDLIVVQQAPRGYSMVARYTTNMILPGFRHTDIPGYLASLLPDAPSELFYCLDLSRFVAKTQ